MTPDADVASNTDEVPESAMKTLYVLRHAKSGWDDPNLTDHDRPLDMRGERAALVMGRYLAQRRFIPDLVLCSTARRAMDTRTLVMSQWNSQPSVECERGLYLSGEKRVLQRLAQVADSVRAVLVIAHNPDLHELAVALARRGDDVQLADLAAKFPTAAFAAIKLPIDRWAGIAHVAGTLINYTIPKQLV